MVQAIFGLIGVVIGGVLTAGFQVFSERSRRRRQQRLAARILFDELAWWYAGLAFAMEQKNLAMTLPPDPVLEAWREWRNALADVDGDEWSRLHSAVRTCQLLSFADYPQAARPRRIWKT